VRAGATVALACCVGACAARHPPPVVPPPPPPGRYLQGPAVDDTHVPAFATAGWAPFTRDAAIAIARREWRLFGSPVHVETAGPQPLPDPATKPERQPGLWQRVGEYWWEGLPPDAKQVSWTGIHDEQGIVFPADQDGTYAWSAAFISYVMRIAGAGAGFPYSASHSLYINAAAAGSTRLLRAHPAASYPPAPGDLICHGRGAARTLQFTDLPVATPFASHCDLVVDKFADHLTVIGGNVDDAVSATAVRLNPVGVLADPLEPWFVVIEVLYAAPAA
jgi:hypothetical protein